MRIPSSFSFRPIWFFFLLLLLFGTSFTGDLWKVIIRTARWKGIHSCPRFRVCDFPKVKKKQSGSSVHLPSQKAFHLAELSVRPSGGDESDPNKGRWLVNDLCQTDGFPCGLWRESQSIGRLRRPSAEEEPRKFQNGSWPFAGPKRKKNGGNDVVRFSIGPRRVHFLRRSSVAAPIEVWSFPQPFHACQLFQWDKNRCARTLDVLRSVVYTSQGRSRWETKSKKKKRTVGRRSFLGSIIIIWAGSGWQWGPGFGTWMWLGRPDLHWPRTAPFWRCRQLLWSRSCAWPRPGIDCVRLLD